MLRHALPLTLLALAVPASAQAGTASVDPSGAVRVVAAGNERNDVRVGTVGATVTVRDANAPLTAGPGCTAAGPDAVTCPVRTSVVVASGSLNDELTGPRTVRDGVDVVLDGGAGNDDFRARAGRIVCGTGVDDVLEASAAVHRRVGEDCDRAVFAGKLLVNTHAKDQSRRRRVMRVDTVGRIAYRGVLVFRTCAGREVARYRLRLARGAGDYIGFSTKVDLPQACMLMSDATRPKAAPIRLF